MTQTLTIILCKNQLKENEILDMCKKCKIFRLPSNEEKRKIWIDKLQLHQSKLYKGCRVCSLHFKEEMFDKTSACGRVRLKENAIPLVSYFIQSFMVYEYVFRNN